MRGGLKDGGAAVVDANRPVKRHGNPLAQLECEVAAVGLRLENLERLPGADSYVARFRADGSRPEPKALKPCRVGARTNSRSPGKLELRDAGRLTTFQAGSVVNRLRGRTSRRKDCNLGVEARRVAARTKCPDQISDPRRICAKTRFTMFAVVSLRQSNGQAVLDPPMEQNFDGGRLDHLSLRIDPGKRRSHLKKPHPAHARAIIAGENQMVEEGDVERFGGLDQAPRRSCVGRARA